MEAPLLALILDVAAFGKACITQYLAQHHLQRVGTHLLHGTSILVRHLLEGFPTDIESSTIAMSRVFRRIDIALRQTLLLLLRACHRSHHDTIRVQSFVSQRVQEVGTNIVYQLCRLWHHLRYRVRQLVQLVVLVALNQFQLLDVGSILGILEWLHTYGFGSSQLCVVVIGKVALVTDYAPDVMRVVHFH